MATIEKEDYKGRGEEYLLSAGFDDFAGGWLVSFAAASSRGRFAGSIGGALGGAVGTGSSR